MKTNFPLCLFHIFKNINKKRTIEKKNGLNCKISLLMLFEHSFHLVFPLRYSEAFPKYLPCQNLKSKHTLNALPRSLMSRIDGEKTQRQPSKLMIE